jgi:hypothetical protein
MPAVVVHGCNPSNLGSLGSLEMSQVGLEHSEALTQNKMKNTKQQQKK